MPDRSTLHPRRPAGRAGRIALIVAGTLAVTAVCAATALAVAAHAVMTSPMLRVHVVDRSAGGATDVAFAMPAAVVAAGLAVAPHVAPEEWRRLRADLGGELHELPVDVQPVVAQILRDLPSLPDATLVEVEERGETVRVEMVRGELRLSVRADDADVDLRVPAVLLARLADLVESDPPGDV